MKAEDLDELFDNGEEDITPYLVRPPDQINDKFVSFLQGRVSLEDFESWVYSTPVLESLLSKDDYLELIAASYSKKSSRQDIGKLINRYVDFPVYETGRLKGMLLAVIERRGDLPDIFNELYTLYCRGLSFLDNLALGYSLYVVVPPTKYGVEDWEELSEEAQVELLDSLYPGAAKTAEEIFDWLERGAVVITAVDYNFGRYKFERKRSNKS